MRVLFVRKEDSMGMGRGGGSYNLARAVSGSECMSREKCSSTQQHKKERKQAEGRQKDGGIYNRQERDRTRPFMQSTITKMADGAAEAAVRTTEWVGGVGEDEGATWLMGR